MKSRLPGRSQSLPGGEPLYQYVSLDDLLQPCSTCKRQSFKCTCIDTSIENPPLKRSEQAAMCDPPGEALRAFYRRCIGELNQAFKRAGEKFACLKAAAPAVYNEVMVPYNHTEFINTLTYLVKNNFIPTSRIDDAVKRILRVKFTMGLFENPLADNSLAHHLGSQAPKILVAGTHAHNIGNQCGGWTITWQGYAGNNITTGTTLLTGITRAVDPETKVVYNENPDTEFVKSNNFSYAVVVVGESPYAEFFGDNLNLTIPDPGLNTISNVCQTVKCVVVLISGRPVVIEPYLNSIDALVAAWLPGSEGQGVADVLFGDFPFTGKLSRTWFKNVDQLPMNVGDPNYDPLFPFGFGLTTKV
nr:lysosomal beta glucosidase-like [Ipomoea batatas]